VTQKALARRRTVALVLAPDRFTAQAEFRSRYIWKQLLTTLGARTC